MSESVSVTHRKIAVGNCLILFIPPHRFLASSLFRPRRFTSVNGGVFSCADVAAARCDVALPTRADVKANGSVTCPASEGQWTLTGAKAAAVCGGLLAEIDLERPQRGLHNLRLPGEPGLSGGLLGISVNCDDAAPGVEPRLTTLPPEEVYLRGGDLVVSYGEPFGQPFKLQAYYRLLASQAPRAATLEAVVSLQTREWEAYPAVVVTSTLPAREVVVASCYAVYRSNADWSYAEATPKGDFIPREHAADSNGLRGVQWRFEPCFMERGVIRRLRLRAAIVPSAEDEPAARRLAEELQYEPPPLTA